MKNENTGSNQVIPGAILGLMLGNIFMPGLGGSVTGAVIGALLANRSEGTDDSTPH